MIAKQVSFLKSLDSNYNLISYVIFLSISQHSLMDLHSAFCSDTFPISAFPSFYQGDKGKGIIDGEVRKCQHALVPCANVIVVENSSLAFPTTCPQRQEQSCLSVTSHYIINACCSLGELMCRQLKVGYLLEHFLKYSSSMHRRCSFLQLNLKFSALHNDRYLILQSP